jgi:GYF domain 2
MRWYVSENGKTSGPFSEQRIAMLVNWGKITSEAYLCDEKWACWVALSRSQFAPLLGELPQEPAARGQSEPPAAQGGWGQRLALTVLIMLAAAAFLLAVWLSPQVPPGPLGQLLPGEPATPVAHTDRPGTPI